MNSHMNIGKRKWTLCLAALSLTAGTGCDRSPEFQRESTTHIVMDAATGPAAAMARFISPSLGASFGWCELPVTESRLDKADSLGRTRPEAAEQVGISLLR
ncbi:MAG TPA: hypothetical protein VJZ71_10225 [Phycisphaerae bacterium]|nr:hypothetical protein [Phycisphaerae bacterium]